MFEAPLTTWRDRNLLPSALLARALLWSRKKLPFEASKIGPPAEWRTRVELPECVSLRGMYRSYGPGNQHSSPPDCPGNERGDEPSKAYRQDLRQGGDATDVNLGTTSGSLDGAWANLRLRPEVGRSLRSSLR